MTSLSNANHNPQKRATTAAYYGTLLGLGLSGASLGPTLQGLAEQTQATIGAISILFTSRSVGGLIGSLGVAKLYDRMSGHRVLAAMLGLGAVSLFLAPLISQLWLLAIIMLVLGIAEISMDVGGNTLLIWLFQEKAAPYLNGLHLMFGLGATLSSILVAMVLKWTGGFQWVYWGIGLVFVPVAIALMRLPSPAKPEENDQHSRNGGSVFTLAFFVLFFYAYVAAEVTYGGWIFTFSMHGGVANEVTAAYLTSSFWMALMVGRLISIPLSARLKNSTIMYWNFLGAFTSMAVIVLGQNSYGWLFWGTFGLGFSFASMFPVMMAFANQHLAVDGRVTGWFMAGASAGGMTVPWLVGQFFEGVGPQTLLWIMVIAIAVTLAAFVVLNRNNKYSSAGVS